MLQYFLGADVGATKTEILVSDEQGNLLGHGRSGPGNHETVGYSGLTQALQQAALSACSQAGTPLEKISGAGFGIAGYDWPCERQKTLAAIAAAGFNSPSSVVNDTVIGLVAGASHGWGIALVSGTGCNCWGWNSGHTKFGRVVGRSSLSGEAAGSSELMEEVMRAISYEWTSRGPHTALTQAVIRKTGARDLTDLLEGYYNDFYKIDGSIAPEVFRIAAEGDPVAKKIVEWAGNELAEIANAVIRQLKFEELSFEIILTGSMFNAGEQLLKPMRKSILSQAPHAVFKRLNVPPAVGAVILGMESAGLNCTSEVRQKLGTGKF